MNKPIRFIGIDFLRGLAAFAVILLHSGDKTWGVPIDNWAIQFRNFFYFAVPFFLAASFYFTTKKYPLNLSLNFWRKKLDRIVKPYLFWSIFYVISKSIIFLMTDEKSQIKKLLSDPLAIIFFGGASYHLYFIPLLLAGMLWLYLANYLTKNSILLLLFYSVFSLIVYQLLLSSSNSFDLGSYTAFSSIIGSIPVESWYYPIWRIILVNLAWMIRCLPYFLIALLINRLFNSSNYYKWLCRKSLICLLLLTFLFLNTIGKNFIPEAFCELAIAYSLLLFGLSISKQLKSNALVANLGLYSFGIYLIHPFVKSGVEIILIQLIPQLTQKVSLVSLLIYSISSFLVSYIFVSFLQKNKLFSRYI